MKGFEHMRERLVPVLFTILYYVCFVPGGLILRALRQDPMQARPDPARQTYWKKRDPHGMSDPMKHPF